MGITVTVIDDRDHVGYAAAATRSGEIPISGVTDMVDKIIQHLIAYRDEPSPVELISHMVTHRTLMPPPPSRVATRIQRLNILDHGNATGVEIGGDWITTASFAGFRPTLARLRPWFEADAFVHLQHCEAGQNIRLLGMFADTFAVPIVAGRGFQNPVYRFNTGNFVRVRPTGPNGRRPRNDTFFWGPSGQ